MTPTPKRPRGEGDRAWVDLWEASGVPWLFRAWGLSLRPARLGLSLVLVVAVTLLLRVPDLWLEGDGLAGLIRDRAGRGLGDLARGVLRLDHVLIAEGLRQVFVATPADAAREFPWSVAAVAIPVLVLWGILGGAVSRSAATEFSLGVRSPWTDSTALAVSRWHSFAGVKIGPLLVPLIAGLVIAASGWLLGIKFVQVAAAILYPLALLAAIGCVLLLVGYALSLPMLIPAVACEGTDAIDAGQRCFAYTLARPGRLALYLLVLVVQGVALVLVVGAILGAGVELCAWAATAWTDADAASYLRAAASRTEISGEGVPASRHAAARLIAFWSALPLTLVSAVAVSYWFSAGTILYLTMRQMCDGQDVGELWSPRPPARGVATDVPEGQDADYE
jgi:hypothetical protein